jgi:pimeloyl-ACP methyl ester carboxylesterase
VSTARRSAAVLAVLIAAAVAPASGSAQGLRLGTVTLHACPAHRPGWCGSVRRALQPGLRGGPSIAVGFEWLPASARRRPRGTVVAVEGGPGYPSTGSIVEYRGIFGPLLRDRNLLLVDNRGTGTSALIRCRRLDAYPLAARASGVRFARVAAACGRALNHRWRIGHGRWLHASDLFGTADAVRDLRAVLGRLGLDRVDLYGDSYGSWFVQAFIARFPGVLRSVILDSTYAVRDLDPSYASSGSSGRAAMDRVCRRDLGCVAAAGRGSATARLSALVARLRRRPLRGTVRGTAPAGSAAQVTVDPRRLADLVQDTGSDPLVLRDLDASVRAALHGDAAPLLRLVAESSADGGSADPGYFSDGDYMAVSCTDYPQLFSLRAAPSVRLAQLRASVAAAPPGVFAPFTAGEWVTMSGYSQPYDVCLDWPSPRPAAPLIAPAARPLPASVPLLVLGGDLDDLTPLADAQRFTRSLGRRVRVVDLVNTVHVTSEGDTYLSDGAACARAIIRGFVTEPGRLARLDTRCAARIPAVQTPGAYDRRLGAVAPAALVAGPDPGRQARRAATVAARAFADAAMQRQTTAAARGLGLRGGRFTVASGNPLRFRLAGVRFVADATVSGTGTYRVAGGVVNAALTVTAGGRRYAVTVSWTQRSRDARARIGAAALALPAP